MRPAIFQSLSAPAPPPAAQAKDLLHNPLLAELFGRDPFKHGCARPPSPPPPLPLL